MGRSLPDQTAACLSQLISRLSPPEKQLDITDRTWDVLVWDIIASCITGFNMTELASKRTTSQEKQTIRQIIHKPMETGAIHAEIAINSTISKLV